MQQKIQFNAERIEVSPSRMLQIKDLKRPEPDGTYKLDGLPVTVNEAFTGKEIRLVCGNTYLTLHY